VRVGFDSPRIAAKVRQFLYDALPDGCEAADLIGLPPISREVARAEHDSSDDRIAEVLHLIDDLHLYAQVLATVWIHIAGWCSEDADPYQVITQHQTMANFALSAMVGTLAALNDDGRILVTSDDD
jgi:hypothetical protein